MEALSLATLLKSFRTHRLAELIHAGAQQALVSVDFDKPVVSRVTIGLEENRKSIRIDEKPISSRAKFPYLGGSLTFSPDDLILIKGGPEERREFLDDLSLALDPLYASCLQKYQKILKQRNALLKRLKEGKALFEELPLWTESLIEAAIPIYQERLKVIGILQETLPSIYQLLFGVSEKLGLRYEHRLAREFTSDPQEIESLLIDKLNILAEAERATGYSLAGPHKDDLEFTINGMIARTFASQGQTRGLVIALKVGQLELSRSIRKMSPILLLDDIISELDDTRVRALVNYLSNYSGQMFVTTAEVSKVKALHSQFSGFQIFDLDPFKAPQKGPQSLALS